MVEQYQKIDKNYIESNKIIKEKQNEIENLEKKISILMNNLAEYKNMNLILKAKLDEINFNNMKNNFEINKIKETQEENINNIIINNEQYYKIRKINENNLNDLDALYFWDKVDMKPKRSYSTGKVIPYLPIININK